MASSELPTLCPPAAAPDRRLSATTASATGCVIFREGISPRVPCFALVDLDRAGRTTTAAAIGTTSTADAAVGGGGVFEGVVLDLATVTRRIDSDLSRAQAATPSAQAQRLRSAAPRCPLAELAPSAEAPLAGYRSRSDGLAASLLHLPHLEGPLAAHP